MEGKPIIAHVIDLFPNETDFIFICSKEHLKNPNYGMNETLQKFCPTGKVIGIPPHKLGPVYAVKQAFDHIDDHRPVIVNYCDFTCYWDYHDFKRFVSRNRCDGAIPAYKDFHPHTLGTTNYAYVKEEKGWVLDIQEKQPYTNNRMNEFASSGTYYFISGGLLKKAFEKTISKKLMVGGEFYVSLAYKPLLAEKRKVAVYPLEHFMQWGTPHDVSEYKKYSSAFRALAAHAPIAGRPSGSVLIPMAGLGKRFLDEGYKETKPLIHISGKPMVIQATNDLPPAKNYGFVLRKDMAKCDLAVELLTTNFPGATVKVIDEVTEGQACTAMIGLEAMENNVKHLDEPLTIGACDSGAIYSFDKLQKLVNDPEVDVIVWGVRGHPNAIQNPEMFGWIREENNIVKAVSVKTPLENPATDPIIIGTFTFCKISDFKRCVERMILRQGRINGEYYIDTAIADAISLDLRCVLFEIDNYLSWGTPNDLKTFEYWQSCFHKWAGHPYDLKNDKRVDRRRLSYIKNGK